MQRSQQSVLKKHKEEKHCTSKLQSLVQKSGLPCEKRVAQIRHNTSKSEGLPNASMPLGHPLPLDEHACSVSLPTWSSVVGYEEGSPQVTEKLACGYPRFVYHPYVIKLMAVALEMDKKLQCQNDESKPKDSEWE